MKRIWFLVLMTFFPYAHESLALDIAGIQPVAPYGVFSTFSTESLPKYKLSFEIAAERSREPDFYRFNGKASYGITDDVELNVMVPYVYNFLGTSDGYEDISIGVKHRFYNEGKYGPSLAYLLNASLPSGKNAFSTEGRFGIGFIVSKRVGPFKGHMNLFYEKPGKKSLKDEISFSGGIEFSAAHNFKILGEIFTKKGHYSDEYDQMEARFGYRINTSGSLYTTIGVGLDLKRRTPEYRVMFSVGFTSPENKKELRKIIEEE